MDNKKYDILVNLASLSGILGWWRYITAYIDYSKYPDMIIDSLADIVLSIFNFTKALLLVCTFPLWFIPASIILYTTRRQWARDKLKETDSNG